MDPAEPRETVHYERRKFLQRIATTGVAAGAVAIPAWAQASAQETTPAEAATHPVANASGPQLASTLAHYAIEFSYDSIPPDVVRLTKRTLIDTIGCGIGGFSSEPSQIANRLAGGVSATRGSTVMCSGVKTSPDLAAFANGVMIRYLDFNDGYLSLGGGHPSDAIAPLLSAAEITGSNGKDLISSTVVSYEIFCRLCDALDNRAIGIDYATLIGIAATAGTGRLMGLTQGQIADAIDIYVAGNVALNQTRAGSVSNWKACSAPDASRKAIFAAQLSQAGLTGPDQVFEGRDGFYNRIKRFQLPALSTGSEPFAMLHCFTKRFALGQLAQTVVEAAVEARAFVPDIEAIQDINIHVSHVAIEVMADSPDKWNPQTHETADHSIPYATAVAMSYGTIDDKYYEEPYLHDRRIRDLIGKVHVILSDEADRATGEINLCDFEVVLKSGQRKIIRVEYHRGHWKNPMTDAELEEKFRSLARRQLTNAQADNLLLQLWSLEYLPRIDGLMSGTVRV